VATTAAASERYNVTEIVDRNVASGRGGKPAVMAPDATLTYDELRRRVNQAGHLLRELGVHREHRVLLVLDDTTVFPVVFLGAMRIGAVPVPVSPLDRDENFRHYVEDSYAEIVVADATIIPRLRAAVPDFDLRFISSGATEDGVIDFDDAVSGLSDELDPAPTHRDDMAFWLYSSGSTGKPKGVVHLHHDVEVTCDTFAGQVLGIREDDVLFSTTKLYHAYGLGNSLTFPLSSGATSVLMTGPPRPDAVFATLRERRPTVFCSVPTLYALMVREPGAADAFESVRLCVSAAEPLAPTTLDRWMERFGLEIVDGIGSTEMLHIFCSNRPGAIERGTTGWPVPGYELRIVDEDGRTLEGPAVGNLEVRGDSCAAYYWHQREKTKACMRGDWFATGDRFERREDGAYVYVGRVDDMLKVGGLWVSPVDMEHVLMAHPEVQAAGVVGVRIEDASRIAAFVVRAGGEKPEQELADELRTWCKERMRRYEYPHVVHLVDELPRTLNGKVQRFELRALAEQLAGG
jgi:benzoate-CoA ligase family protein